MFRCLPKMIFRSRHRSGFRDPLLIFSLILVLMLIALSGARDNLDIIEPIVLRSPAQADSNDDFGFAVVLHLIQNPIPGNFESFINSSRYNFLRNMGNAIVI